jgi:hypothetical protein
VELFGREGGTESLDDDSLSGLPVRLHDLPLRCGRRL